MAYLTEQVKTFGGLNCHVVSTDKFKTTTIILRFKTPLDERRVTARALLSHVLKNATAESPVPQQLERRLDDLYGATLSSGLAKKGNAHILSLAITVANERFISDRTPLLEQALNLLAEVAFRPLTRNGAFDKAVVSKQQRSLKQYIRSVYDDKIRYANQRLIDEMCSQEIFRLHTYGYAEEVDGISPEALYETWRTMLAQDKIDLYLVGQVEPETAFEQVKNVFHFAERPAQAIKEERTLPAPEKVRIVEERQAVAQGKLNMGFRTDIVLGDRLYDAFQVFNGLFGVFPHSKLFMNVREKASLAYYASSSYEGLKGLLIVNSGIESVNYDKAVSIIKDQLKDIQGGRFSKGEMDQTKALLRNILLESLDSPFSIVNLLYQRVLGSTFTSVEDRLKNIDAVTRDEIIEAAKRTALDTIFFLKSEAA
ncbi:insulinase family protein [Sporolactobacillus sp. THM7-7]|nr:insulinase family protein [Sporolactobacillus sp. THM7-7]